MKKVALLITLTCMMGAVSARYIPGLYGGGDVLVQRRDTNWLDAKPDAPDGGYEKYPQYEKHPQNVIVIYAGGGNGGGVSDASEGKQKTKRSLVKYGIASVAATVLGLYAINRTFKLVAMPESWKMFFVRKFGGGLLEQMGKYISWAGCTALLASAVAWIGGKSV